MPAEIIVLGALSFIVILCLIKVDADLKDSIQEIERLKNIVRNSLHYEGTDDLSNKVAKILWETFDNKKTRYDTTN